MQDLDPHLAELARHFFEAAGGLRRRQGGRLRRAGWGDARWCCWPTRKRPGCSRWPWPPSAWRGLGGEDQARCLLLLALGDALTRMGERDPLIEDRLLRVACIARRYRMAEELGRAALAYAGRFTFERGAQPHTGR